MLCRGALVTKNRELGSLPFEDPANEIESEPERCESSVSARRHPLQIFYGQAGAVRLVIKPIYQCRDKVAFERAVIVHQIGEIQVLRNGSA